MVVLVSALTSVLLAVPALAAPASIIVKKGIRVEAHRYIPSNATIDQDTGAVYANFDGGGWVLLVLIGGQQLYLNIDTGSSDIWTASTLMPSDQQSTITTGTIYDPSSSSTYQAMGGYTFGIAYADGSGASGPAGKDTVDIGGASIPDMPFGVCNDLKYPGGGSGTRDTDGPVGLGFGVENSIRPTPQCTFMEYLEPYVPEPIFGTSFKLNSSGFVDFGYADTAQYTGDLTEIPIANTSSGNEGQWVTQGVKFGSGGNVFSADAIDLDFDSGTASLSVSAGVASAYWALVPGSDASTCQYPCGSTLPDFDFIFPSVISGPTTVTIPGVNLKNGDASSGTCSTWMNVVTGRGNGGLPFYISKYMIWNQATPSLSFADQVN